MLETFISGIDGNGPLCIMGTSLGGFYALQLRLAGIAKVAAWNPVIFPALQLARFTGENTRFTDGAKWNFSRQALVSYAAAPDPRIWRNFAWHEAAWEAPARQIFIGEYDDVLDYEVGAEFWAAHAPVMILSSGHSIVNFEHALDFLRS